MPSQIPEGVLEAADAAVVFAQQVRRLHRKRSDKKSPQRRSDIQLALTRLKEAMTPLRSEIGRFPYGPQTERAEANRQAIRTASAEIQRERRKLWKLNQR